MHKFRVSVRQCWHQDRLDIYLIGESDTAVWVAKPVELEFDRVEEGSDLVEPTLKVTRRMMRMGIKDALLEALQEQGLYEPSRVDYLKGQLERVDNHLADMRALVFKKDT